MTGTRLALAVSLALILQLAVVRRIAVFGIQPDLTVLLVVLVALRRGATTGTLVGFTIGLLQDLLVPETLGMNALAKSVCGWAVGKLSEQLAIEGPVLYFGLVAITLLAHDVVYLVCLTRLDLARFFTAFLTQSIPSAVYTGALSVLITFVATALQQGMLPRRMERGGGSRG